MPESKTIFTEIEALLASGANPRLEELEDTLTSGYAEALALEAERWRLERRIAEVAALVGEGRSRGKTRELSNLAQRLTSTDTDLAELRALLGSLRERADAARAAA
jgi:hypothetical protein